MGEPRTEAGRRFLGSILAIEAETGGLDAAWAEAEAALPEGWYIGALTQRPQRPDRWLAQAYEPTERMSFVAGWGDTPAAALRALAAKLRG